MLSKQLFVGQNLVLDYYDLDKDPQEEAKYASDPDYFWGMDNDAFPRPLTVFEIKKKRAEHLKAVLDKGNAYYFALRNKEDNSFLGVIAFPWVWWNSRSSFMTVILGTPDLCRKYFDEALAMGLRYAFEELDLKELTINTGEFQPHIMEALIKAGLHQAVQMRENVYRDGQYYDKIMMEMLQEEWQLKSAEVNRD